MVSNGQIDREARRVDINKYNEYKRVYNKVENKVNETLHKLNSDLTKTFKYYDTTIPGETGRFMDDKHRRLNEYMRSRVSLSDLNFETSNDSNVNFSGKNMDKLKDDENFKMLEDGKYDIVGYAADPVLGLKILINAEKKGGGKVQHIVSPKNSDVAYNFVDAAGSEELTKNYQTFFHTNEGERVYNSILNSPDKKQLAPIAQETVNSYFSRLESAVTKGIIPEEEAVSVMFFLTSKGLREEDTF